MAAKAREERKPRRPERSAGRFVLPAAAAGLLLLTVAAAAMVFGGTAAEPRPAPTAVAAGVGRGPVVSTSNGREAVAVSAGVQLSAADIALAARSAQVAQTVKPSPDALQPGTPERAAAEFAGALAGGGLNEALGKSDAAPLADLKVTGADVGAAKSRSPDRADVPLRLSYDTPSGPTTTAVDAAVNRDPSGAWQVDAAGLARDLAPTTRPSLAPTTAAAPTALPKPADPQTSAALAALGQAMQSNGGTAVPTPALGSGGLGLTQQDWEQQHNRRGASGWFAVQYRDGGIYRLDKTMGADSRLAVDDARREARTLAPEDAQATSRATIAGDPVDLFSSASLGSRFRDPAAKPGDPARFHVRYHLSGDRVVGYTLQLGAP